MKKIFVINGAPQFAHSGGELNKTLLNITVDYFKNQDGYEVKSTDINEEYNLSDEVDKFVWADLIIYHTSVWWMNLPFNFKEYLDTVFTEGYGKIYKHDGRSSKNPTKNYGTGGLLQGSKYMLTTTWNAPLNAFEEAGEFFEQRSVDDGVMFSFHKMNQFIGLTKLEGIHFYDVMKNLNIEDIQTNYIKHLDQIKLSV